MQTDVRLFALIANFLQNRYGFPVSLLCSFDVPPCAARSPHLLEPRLAGLGFRVGGRFQANSHTSLSLRSVFP